MDSLGLIIILILILICFSSGRRTRAARNVMEMKKRHKNGGTKEMLELAKRFIGKDCIIYTMDVTHHAEGVILEVLDGALLIENKGKTEAINLDYVTRIREYPVNKNGKRKSLVLE